MKTAYALNVGQLIQILMAYPKDTKVAAPEPCEQGFGTRVQVQPGLESKTKEPVVLIHMMSNQIGPVGYGEFEPVPDEAP